MFLFRITVAFGLSIMFVSAVVDCYTGRESVLAKLQVNKLRVPYRHGEFKRKSSSLDLLKRLKFQMKTRRKEKTEVLRGKIQRLKDSCHAMDVDETGRLERNQVRNYDPVLSPPLLCIHGPSP